MSSCSNPTGLRQPQHEQWPPNDSRLANGYTQTHIFIYLFIYIYRWILYTLYTYIYIYLCVSVGLLEVDKPWKGRRDSNSSGQRLSDPWAESPWFHGDDWGFRPLGNPRIHITQVNAQEPICLGDHVPKFPWLSWWNHIQIYACIYIYICMYDHICSKHE